MEILIQTICLVVIAVSTAIIAIRGLR